MERASPSLALKNRKQSFANRRCETGVAPIQIDVPVITRRSSTSLISDDKTYDPIIKR